MDAVLELPCGCCSSHSALISLLTQKEKTFCCWTLICCSVVILNFASSIFSSFFSSASCFEEPSFCSINKNAVLFRFSQVRSLFAPVMFSSLAIQGTSGSSLCHNSYVFMLIYFSLTFSVVLYYCLPDPPIVRLSSISMDWFWS